MQNERYYYQTLPKDKDAICELQQALITARGS